MSSVPLERCETWLTLGAYSTKAGVPRHSGHTAVRPCLTQKKTDRCEWGSLKCSHKSLVCKSTLISLNFYNWLCLLLAIFLLHVFIFREGCIRWHCPVSWLYCWLSQFSNEFGRPSDMENCSINRLVLLSLHKEFSWRTGCPESSFINFPITLNSG